VAHQQVLLDVSGVTFIDGRGVAMLKRMTSTKLQIINCAALLEDLLKGGGEPWNEPEE